MKNIYTSCHRLEGSGTIKHRVRDVGLWQIDWMRWRISSAVRLASETVANSSRIKLGELKK